MNPAPISTNAGPDGQSGADGHSGAARDADALARIVILARVSIIVPTYREVDNIPHVIARIARLRDQDGIDVELIFVDDNSNDGSLELVRDCGQPWARMIVRTEDRGLSKAVLEGFRQATGPVLVCMDCDLSHPPEKIPQMVLALSTGQQFALGSRYVAGGSTDDDWGMFRWLNSRIATILARPLTSVRDPMSGFFAMRKSDFDVAEDLNPVGYKIALELIVKCGFTNVAEVPIAFSDRLYGTSKLNFREQLRYIQHLRRLYLHKFSSAMYFLQFMVVGFSGVAVNLLVLTLLLAMGLPDAVCLAGAIGVSVVTNFLLNRRFTFSYARQGNILRQFAGFLSVSSVGIAINYTVAMLLLGGALKDAPYALHLSSLGGIASGLIFNYMGNRYVIFRKTRIRK